MKNLLLSPEVKTTPHFKNNPLHFEQHPISRYSSPLPLQYNFKANFSSDFKFYSWVSFSSHPDKKVITIPHSLSEWITNIATKLYYLSYLARRWELLQLPQTKKNHLIWVFLFFSWFWDCKRVLFLIYFTTKCKTKSPINRL